MMIHDILANRSASFLQPMMLLVASSALVLLLGLSQSLSLWFLLLMIGSWSLWWFSARLVGLSQRNMYVFVGLTLLSPVAVFLSLNGNIDVISEWWLYGYGWLVGMIWFLEYAREARRRSRLIVLTIVVLVYGVWVQRPTLVPVAGIWTLLPLAGMVMTRALEERLQQKWLRSAILSGWWIMSLIEVGWILIDGWWV